MLKGNLYHSSFSIQNNIINYNNADTPLRITNKKFPHFIIAYNAGIWGYDVWKPTLKVMNDILPHRIPFVVTSYTLEEGEEDFEVISKIVDGCHKDENEDKEHTSSSSLLFDVEINPYGSRKVRETLSNPGETNYFENCAWQAWTMGTCTHS